MTVILLYLIVFWCVILYCLDCRVLYMLFRWCRCVRCICYYIFFKTTASLEFVEVCDCLEGGGVVGQVCYVWRLPSTPPRVGGVVVLVERPRGQGRHGSERVIQSS